jgi:short-subunit dehydrogenase
MSAHLDGRVILIVGGAQGIGAATAVRLLEAGARVALADVNADELERRRRDLAGRGYPVVTVPVDVRRVETIDVALARTREALGDVDAVINCAAVLHPAAIADASLDDVRQEVEVNLLGTMAIARVFVPYFRSRGRGHLVLVASLGGIVPMPGGAGYCATKFAVRGFGLALGLELRGSGVAVSVICPDSTDTAQLRTEALHEGSAMSFTSAPLDPDDVARAIARTIRRPRPETLVPGPRGLLAKLLAFSPRLLRLLYPLLDWIGRKGRQRYLDHLHAIPAGESAPAALVRGTP